MIRRGFPVGSVIKNSPANAGDTGDAGSMPRWGMSPGGGSGNSLQYPCLGSLVDRGALWARIHGVSRVGHNLVTKQ